MPLRINEKVICAFDLFEDENGFISFKHLIIILTVIFFNSLLIWIFL